VRELTRHRRHRPGRLRPARGGRRLLHRSPAPGEAGEHPAALQRDERQHLVQAGRPLTASAPRSMPYLRAPRTGLCARERTALTGSPLLRTHLEGNYGEVRWNP
jgi:hypothetical protein